MKESKAKLSKEDYNEEPIHICTHCNSLYIKVLDNTNIGYCVDCGNTDIEQGHIEDWLFKQKLRESKNLNTLELEKIINSINSRNK